MSQLTVQILTLNNQKQIETALKSILSLEAEILVGDFGSNDKTKDLCESYGARVIDLKESDRSKARNKLSEEARHKWQFYIQPYEKLVDGQVPTLIEIIEKNKSPLWHFKVFQGDVLTKEIRLWQREFKFTNPIYECLNGESKDSGCIIFSKMIEQSKNLQLVQKWRNKEPASNEPYYYEACALLSQMKYDEFLKTASIYLFKEKSELMPIIMTRYYCSMVYCHVKKDHNLAIRNLMPCLIAKPLMAEFWCLLGDVYYKLLKKYNKATAFYDNALKLGAHRQNDMWPMEIKKYRDYPILMKRQCSHKIDRSEHFGLMIK